MQKYGSNRSRTARACTSKPLGKGVWRRVFLTPALALLLCACSPTTMHPVTPITENAPAPSSAAVQPSPAMRVIVKFRTTVAYADAAFLQTIGQQVNARIIYLASVSADTHVYRMEPLAHQTPAEILQRLAGVPSVLHVEADARATPS